MPDICYILTINFKVLKANTMERGVLHHIFSSCVQHTIKYWTQLDLRFCKNEGPKRCKINEKGGQLDQK